MDDFLGNVISGWGSKDFWMASSGLWEDDRCLHVALPIEAFIEMLTKSVASRATTATRAGCVQRGMGRNTPFSMRGSRNPAEDDPRPSILLNTEGLTASKITVAEQLAYKKGIHHRPT